MRQEGGGSAVGIPWEDLGSSPGPGRRGSCRPHGASKEPRNVELSPPLDLRSCPDKCSGNKGFQEHSGKSSFRALS